MRFDDPVLEHLRDVLRGGSELLIGRMALDQGLLSPERLEQALSAQESRRPRAPLGVVLVDLGLLTREQVEALLAAQGEALGLGQVQAWRLGRRAIQTRLASVEQVHRALVEQARRAEAGEPHAPLGALLVEQGALSSEQLAELLRERADANVAGAPTLGSSGHHGECVPETRGQSSGAPSGSAAAIDAPAGPSGTALPSGGASAAPGPARATAVRRRLARYELLEELGRGGMGVVYRAFDTELRREVALKTLLFVDASNPEAMERLRREARATGVLEHPAIPAIYEVGEMEGMPYFAMAYVRGRTLSQVLRANLLTGPRERAQIVRDMAAAVAHAHERKVVHRDLKPGNVLIGEDGKVHVMDFGLAKRLDEGTRLTATGQVLGTPQYMPPEQIEGEVARIGTASDVYALGAVLYEALTGRPPFDGTSVAEVISLALSRDPVPPRSLDRTLPADLETICLKALAKEPERRYPTAREFADDLTCWLEGRAISARPEAWWERGFRFARRRRPLVAVAALALLATLAASVARREQRRSEEGRQVLQAKLLEGLRDHARTNLEAVLVLRRAGKGLAESANFLTSLQKSVQGVLEQAPELAEPHFHLGRMYRAMLRFDAALEEQDRALAKDPDYAPSLYERAVLRAQLHGHRQGELLELWLAAEGRRLGDGGAVSAGAPEPGAPGPGAVPRQAPSSGLQRRGFFDQDEPLTRLRAGLAADLARLEQGLARPGADSALSVARRDCARGLVRILADEPEARAEARALLERALAADPFLEEAHTALSADARDRGDLAGSLALLTRAIAADPGYPPHWSSRGLIRLNITREAARRGEDPDPVFAAAIADLTRALELTPSSASVWCWRGNLHDSWASHLENVGRDPSPLRRDALADYSKAIDLDAGFALAWCRRGSTKVSLVRESIASGPDAEDLLAAAIADLDRALALAPRNGDFRLRRSQVHWDRAECLYRQGADPAPEFAAAMTDLDAALMLDPTDSVSWRMRGLVRGRRCFLSGTGREEEAAGYEAAAADFDRSFALAPDDPTTWVRHASLQRWRAEYLSKRGESAEDAYTGSIADLDRAVRLAPADPWPLHERGETFSEWGMARSTRGEDGRTQFEAAIADFDQVLELHPGRIPTWIARGRVRASWAARTSGDGRDASALFADALADFDQALELQPENVRARSVRAEARVQWSGASLSRGQDVGGLLDRAIADFDAALARDPTAVSIRLGRGLAHLNRGVQRRNAGADPGDDFTAAIADAEQVLARTHADATAWLLRANARNNWGNYRGSRGVDPGEFLTQAIADYGEVLRRNRADTQAWLGRAGANLVWAMYRSTHDQDPEALYSAALEDLRVALELRPSDPEAWRTAGRTRTDWGDHRVLRREDPVPLYTAAIGDYDRALSLRPDDPFLLTWRAVTRLKWGEHLHRNGEDPHDSFFAAIADLDRALQRTPTDPNAWLHRGRAHHYWGTILENRGEDREPSFRAALSDYDRYLAVAPNRADVRAAAERLRASLATPAWRAHLARGDAAIQAGDHAAARAAYEAGLKALEAAPTERTTLLGDPAGRRELAFAHYNLACIHARSSTLATASPIGTGEGPEALREFAMVQLEQAVELGWTDRTHLVQDPDLDSLHAHPRWSLLLQRLPR